MQSLQLLERAKRHLGRLPRRPHIYYLTVLRIIASGVRNRSTHEQIAGRLTESGVRTRTGNEWNAHWVTEVLGSIRNPGKRGVIWHEELIEAMERAEIPLEDCLLLLGRFH